MENIYIQAKKHQLEASFLKKLLLISGILSIMWYVVVNIIVPFYYPGYNIASQTVSELSAIDAPSRSLWIILCIPFSLLVAAFGFGVWLSTNNNKKLLVAAAVIIFDAIFGFFWPPMHQRQLISAGGGTLTDDLHLAWTFIHLVFVLLMIGFGAAALDKRFRIYSIATVIVFIVFGTLTALESPGIEAGTSTPHIGIWERINMGAYMLWVVVFAIVLLRMQKITKYN